MSSIRKFPVISRRYFVLTSGYNKSIGSLSGGLRVIDSGKTRRAFRYRLDRKIRAWVMTIMSWITPRSSERSMDVRRQAIKRILLVRGVFRMGDSILATPAIVLFRKNFPEARIDFVGSRIAKELFENLPVNHQYEVCQRFPKVCWSYLTILRRIRNTKYDLAEIGRASCRERV